jgi:hypothetical protein
MKIGPVLNSSARLPAAVATSGLLALVAASSAAAANSLGCGSLTLHGAGGKSATETQTTVSGVSCDYATRVFLPDAALATAAYKLFSA